MVHRAKKAISATSRVLTRLTPTRMAGMKAKRKLIENFADRVGMVYFGSVSQQSDEHHIVRGLTVSNKHHDAHYCIGTHHHYDAVFVERTDTILTNHTHTWHIMEIDLKTTRDIPHIFISSPTHGLGFHSLLSAKYPQLLPANLGALGSYPASFSKHFNIYVTPAHAVQAEQLISPKEAELIGSHCKGLVFEITPDAVYVYSEKASLSQPLLDTMLANGVWLAHTIDQKSQSL